LAKTQILTDNELTDDQKSTGLPVKNQKNLKQNKFPANDFHIFRIIEQKW